MDELRSPIRLVRRALAIVISLLATLEASSAMAATLTRGPYLQLLTTSSVTVVWNTDTSAACSLAIRALPNGPTTILPGATSTVCAIAVAGLTPGAQYGYVPRAGSTALTNESAFFADDPTQPFTFLVLGDTGSGDANQLAVAARMLATPADFVVHTGDMIYETGAAVDFNPKFFTPYRDLIPGLVFWPCLGNHDWATSTGQPWRDAFYTPANNTAGSENYYSFDYGNAHVVVLNSNASTSPGSAQYAFLDANLAASSARWKVVAFHHTIYSSAAGHGGNLTIRGNLVPLFDKHHVDLVFMGHDHDYERTKPLVASQVVGPGQGTVYITTGGGGRELTAAGTSALTAYAESSHHFTRVAVNGPTLELDMIRVDGSMADVAGLSKNPLGVCGDGVINPGEVCDDGNAVNGDGCDANCMPTRCGNGVRSAGEACDDGNLLECDGCSPTCTVETIVCLPAVADTHIQNGTEASWDHGAATALEVDRKPYDLTYLKFDLSSVTAPVQSATLKLFCTNESPDGGTVYPVADSSWVEGTGDGLSASSASGPGLKWTQVDTNRDGTLSTADTSPWVPDFTRPLGALGTVAIGQTVRVDVSAGFQATGPAIRTLAIRNGSSNGAWFLPRTDASIAGRPLLILDLVGAACSSDADCDDGRYCSGVERCVTGHCQAGTPVLCDDLVGCTADSCDEAAGTCRYVPSDAACSDGNACTGDTCSAALGCRYTALPCPTTVPTPIPTPTTVNPTGVPTSAPTAIDLAPLADTYIEKGTEATWDHGASGHLDVDTSPYGISYLKFDLTGITRPVTSATLTLRCTNSSNDGGVIYPLTDSSWVEGTGNGIDASSAGGPGLKWGDVDSNGDGTIDTLDASPYRPDFTAPIAALGSVTASTTLSATVTSAFQQGPRVYTLTIKNASSDGATYSSRQHPTVTSRPKLHLTLGP